MADKKVQNAISPTREQDYPEWYQQVIRAADLAENSPVRGCMVIKPWGYSIWENIKMSDAKFRVPKCLFSLVYTKSFLEKRHNTLRVLPKSVGCDSSPPEAGPGGKLFLLESWKSL